MKTEEEFEQKYKLTQEWVHRADMLVLDPHTRTLTGEVMEEEDFGFPNRVFALYRRSKGDDAYEQIAEFTDEYAAWEEYDKLKAKYAKANKNE